MADSKKSTQTEEAPQSSQPTAEEIADAVHAKMTEEPQTGNPTPEAIAAERQRVENAEHPQMPEMLNSEGELISENDVPPADVKLDDMRAMIPPPRTSSYVTFPNELRDAAENDKAEDHYDPTYDADGNETGTKGHWVQVVQVRTYDDGRVPSVSLRCQCNREYTVDWTGDAAEKIVQVSRT